MTGKRRINAYIMLGDPSWMRTSLESYASAIDRLVVAVDENNRSWAGVDLTPAIEASRKLLARLDLDCEIQWLERDFRAVGGNLIAAETLQRQAALDAASDGADWVVQLDTDEVVPDLDFFLRCVKAADRAGADALNYSLRSVRSHIAGSWFVEESLRRMTYADAIPGPTAVRSGTRLQLCRKADVPDFNCTVNWRPDRKITPDKAIIHFSWVRSAAVFRAKSRISGHANDFDWGPILREWEDLTMRPLRTVARYNARPRLRDGRGYRPVRLPSRFNGQLVAEETTLGPGE